MLTVIEYLFYIVAILNVGLATFSIVEWSINYKANHTRYRWLYLLWILISFLFCGLYLDIVFSTVPKNIVANATVHMLIIRPAITLVLAASALTAEIMRYIRLRGKILSDIK